MTTEAETEEVQETITTFIDKNETFKTQYGRLDGQEWLLKEKERIALHGVKTNIVTRADGKIALARV